MMNMMRKSQPVLDVKELRDDGQFQGYGSTFGGEPDSYGDVIVAGAFAASLQEHRAKGTMPKLFWQHNAAEPIGKWLEAVEDDTGLLMTGQLNMNVQRGREAHALLKAGDIDGLSIGYRIKKYERDEDSDVWFLKELQLQEVSVVSIGANENATVSDVKSHREVALLVERLKAGERLTERQFGKMLKGILSFSNSEAERAARVCLKGQGDLADAETEGLAMLAALSKAVS